MIDLVRLRDIRIGAAAKADCVAVGQLSTSPGLDFTIDQNFTVLDEVLGVSTGSGNSAQFEELIEPHRLMICHWSMFHEEICWSMQSLADCPIASKLAIGCRGGASKIRLGA